MPLATGTRLGPYEIQSAIGAGGPPSLRHDGTGLGRPVVTHINLIQNWLEELKQKVPPPR